MNEENVDKNNDGERLITQQEARVVYKLTPAMLQHIKPLGYYLRVGSGQKVFIYRLADIQRFLDSEEGKTMMERAQMRRRRFYDGLRKQYAEWLRQAHEGTSEEGEQDKSDKE